MLQARLRSAGRTRFTLFHIVDDAKLPGWLFPPECWLLSGCYLAVRLADNWLLFDNSQLLHKPLLRLIKFAPNSQHNSQRKIPLA
jgi:hypothetical protein